MGRLSYFLGAVFICLFISGLSTSDKAMAQAFTQALTQGQKNIIGSYRKWDAMSEKDRNSNQCFMISMPTKWRASKSGVKRGDIYFMVKTQPRFRIKNQVYTVVGYPLRPGSEVRITIDGRHQFKLFVEGDAAWSYSPQDDKRLVERMKAGSTMVVQGTSSRGTRTTDTYSLSGFTAANNAINKRCPT